VTITPFRIEIPDSVLVDLLERLARTRLPVGPNDWDHGTNPVYLKELCADWCSGLDWRRQEKALNRFYHYRAEGADMDFISCIIAAKGRIQSPCYWFTVGRIPSPDFLS
jgi:hypothetical protein